MGELETTKEDEEGKREKRVFKYFSSSHLHACINKNRGCNSDASIWDSWRSSLKWDSIFTVSRAFLLLAENDDVRPVPFFPFLSVPVAFFSQFLTSGCHISN